jgi:hypothetical protein
MACAVVATSFADPMPTELDWTGSEGCCVRTSKGAVERLRSVIVSTESLDALSLQSRSRSCFKVQAVTCLRLRQPTQTGEIW